MGGDWTLWHGLRISQSVGDDLKFVLGVSWGHKRWWRGIVLTSGSCGGHGIYSVVNILTQKVKIWEDREKY